MAKEFSGDNVGYANGVISADIVVEYTYADRAWRAKDIASRAERFAWDTSSQGKDNLISYTEPNQITTITTAYGTFKVLSLENYKQKLDVESTLFIDLSSGNLVRLSAKDTIIDILYNSLDVEKASIVKNSQGEIIETTESKLTATGKPQTVKDAQGIILPGRILKHVKNYNAPMESDLIQNLANGLIDYAIISPEFLGKDIQWWISIKYDKEENELYTQTIAYQSGTKLGEVKHTETLELGNGLLRKKESFANGNIITYEQDAVTGLKDNIEMEVETSLGETHKWTTKIAYNSKRIETSRRVYADGNPQDWVMIADGSLENGEIISKYTKANGEKGEMIIDVATGLLKKLSFENAQIVPGQTDTLITTLDYTPLGIELKSRTFSNALKQYIAETEKSDETGRVKIIKDLIKGSVSTYTYNTAGLLKEIASLKDLRANYVALYEDHKADVEEGKLPPFKFARDSVYFEAECLLKIYSTSVHLSELAQSALQDHKAGDLFLEQATIGELEETVKILLGEIEGMEKNVCNRLYRGYEASF